MRLYTFGSPRVGNAVFAEWFEQEIEVRFVWMVCVGGGLRVRIFVRVGGVCGLSRGSRRAGVAGVRAREAVTLTASSPSHPPTSSTQPAARAPTVHP